MKVASNESGARIYDGTAEEQNKDCYFQSTWEREDYDHMSANANRITSFVKTFCPDLADGSRSINNVPILMLINDDRYVYCPYVWVRFYLLHGPEDGQKTELVLLCYRSGQRHRRTGQYSYGYKCREG